MTDHKFTDDEIKMGLRCLSGEIILCKFCAFSHLEDRGFACKKNVSNAALALINRQKAEIERRKEEIRELDLKNHLLYDEGKAWYEQCKTAKSEAIKEFAQRLKADIVETGDEHGLGNSYPILTHNYIDTLVKEMTEESKR